MQRITDFDYITADLNLTNPIEIHLWEDLLESQWETIGQIVNQLESASCSAGSWSGFIYTRDILDCLSYQAWQDAIDDALARYRDNTGESYAFESLSETVTFAVDWAASNLASKLRYLDRVAVVWVYSDTMDPHPDAIAFGSDWEAEDWASEEIERRVQHRVDHSPHPVSDGEREQWAEEESQLVIVKEERL